MKPFPRQVLAGSTSTDVCSAVDGANRAVCGAGVNCVTCIEDEKIVCTKCRTFYFSVLATSPEGVRFTVKAIRDVAAFGKTTFTCDHCSLSPDKCADCEVSQFANSLTCMHAISS